MLPEILWLLMIGTPRSGLPCVDDYYLSLRVCVTIRHDPYPGIDYTCKTIFGASSLNSGSCIDILAKDRQYLERPESARFPDFCFKLSSFAVIDIVIHHLRQMSLRDAFHVSMPGRYAVRSIVRDRHATFHLSDSPSTTQVLKFWRLNMSQSRK